MSTFKCIKNSHLLARRLNSARYFLKNSHEFLAHVTKSIAEKDKILPLDPQGMQQLYNDEHESLMESVVRAFLKVHKDQESNFNIVSVKTYMEGHALHPPINLIDFFSFLMANRIVVSSKKQWIGPNFNFYGIVRAAPRMPFDCATLASDASLHVKHPIAGGGFLFWPDGSYPYSCKYRCGKIRIPEPVSHSNHPLSNRMLVRLELEALLQGLQFIAHTSPDLTHLRVLLDSLDVTEILNGRLSIPDDESYGEYTTVISLLRRYIYNVEHIVRERNLAADRLAYFGKTKEDFTQDWEKNELRPWTKEIREILETDLYNQTVNRYRDDICL